MIQNTHLKLHKDERVREKCNVGKVIRQWLEQEQRPYSPAHIFDMLFVGVLGISSTVARLSYPEHSIYRFLTHQYWQETSGINYCNDNYE